MASANHASSNSAQKHKSVCFVFVFFIVYFLVSFQLSGLSIWFESFPVFIGKQAKMGAGETDSNRSI